MPSSKSTAHPHKHKPDASPIKVSKAHTEVCTDYKDVKYFEAKAKKLGISVQYGDCDIHVFRAICSDSRMRSQRLVNANFVLHRIYERFGNRVYTHTIESVGSRFNNEELVNIRRMMADILNEAEGGRRVVFMIESISHSGIINREGAWATNPKCNYHCGMSGWDRLASQLMEELIADGGIDIPKSGRRFRIKNVEDVTRFLESQYGFAGPIRAPEGHGYIEDIPEPKELMHKEYAKLINYFADEISRGNLFLSNIRTFVTDFSDLSLWQVAGTPGGWSYWLHKLAQLDAGEKPHAARTQKPNAKLMAICHMDNAHRSTVPLREVLKLPPEYVPGNVFVSASGAIEMGVVGQSLHSGLYYFAKKLGGKKVHIRGRAQDETDRFAKMILEDALCNWIIKKYGLEIFIHDNGREAKLSGTPWQGDE